jgi:hypothetical protein
VLTLLFLSFLSFLWNFKLFEFLSLTRRNITSFQGKAHLNDIMPMLLAYLQKGDLSTVVYEQVIVYVGLLSRHLNSNTGEREMQILKVLIKTTVEFDSQEIRTATLGTHFAWFCRHRRRRFFFFFLCVLD